VRTVPIHRRPDVAHRRRRVAAALVVVLAAVACGGGEDDDAAGGDATVTAADADSAGGDASDADDSAGGDASDAAPASGAAAGDDGPLTFADHLSIGECFDDQFDDDGDYDYSRPPPIASCSSAHDNEVIAIADLPGESGAPYPDDDVLDRLFDDVCTVAFEDVAGQPTGLAYFVVYPLEDQWAAGGRSSVCATYLPDAQLGAPVADLDPVVPVSFPTGLPLPDGIYISSVASAEDSYAPADSFLQDTGIDASGWTGVTFEGGEVTAVKAELERGMAVSEWTIVAEDHWRGEVATAYYALERSGDRVIVEIWQLESGESRLHYFHPPA